MESEPPHVVAAVDTVATVLVIDVHIHRDVGHPRLIALEAAREHERVAVGRVMRALGERQGRVTKTAPVTLTTRPFTCAAYALKGAVALPYGARLSPF